MSERERGDLYRTQWLMAHKALHAVMHDDITVEAAWDRYLVELEAADKVARTPA